MPTRPMRILVAEDSEVTRMAAAERLKGRFPDAEIIQAKNYDEAAQLIETADVCVLDLFLGSTPVDRTLDLIYYHPDVQVIAYSASCDPELVELAGERGAVQFVSKTCPSVMLTAGVAMAMRIRQRLLELGRIADIATQGIDETLHILGAR